MCVCFKLRKLKHCCGGDLNPAPKLGVSTTLLDTKANAHTLDLKRKRNEQYLTKNLKVKLFQLKKKKKEQPSSGIPKHSEEINTKLIN